MVIQQLFQGHLMILFGYREKWYIVEKWLIKIGIALIVVGAAFLLLRRAGLTLGRLPGDVVIERDGLRIWFPIVSCLVASGIITAVFWLISVLRKLL